MKNSNQLSILMLIVMVNFGATSARAAVLTSMSGSTYSVTVDSAGVVTIDLGDATVTVEETQERTFAFVAQVDGETHTAQLMVAVPSDSGDPGGAQLLLQNGGHISYMVGTNMEMELYLSTVSNCLDFAQAPAILVLGEVVQLLADNYVSPSVVLNEVLGISVDVMERFSVDCVQSQTQTTNGGICTNFYECCWDICDKEADRDYYECLDDELGYCYTHTFKAFCCKQQAHRTFQSCFALMVCDRAVSSVLTTTGQTL